MVPAHNELAQAHLATPALPTGLPANGGDYAMIRYDGMARSDGPVVYAMISADALAKVPAATMRGLGMLVRGEDGTLRGSPHAFFRDTPAGVTLYVDTEVHEDFLGHFIDSCRANNVEPLVARGDLMLLCFDGNDVNPPSQDPAFVVNGFRPVPVRAALEQVHELRAAFEAERQAAAELREEGNDPVSPTL